VKVVGRAKIGKLVQVIFLKVVFIFLYYVVPNDGHVLVSVMVILHVVEAERVDLYGLIFRHYILLSKVDHLIIQFDSPAHERSFLLTCIHLYSVRVFAFLHACPSLMSIPHQI
jgi:hypothetical protein